MRRRQREQPPYARVGCVDQVRLPECPVGSMKGPAIALPILTGVAVPVDAGLTTVIGTAAVTVAKFAAPAPVAVNVTVSGWAAPTGNTTPVATAPVAVL